MTRTELAQLLAILSGFDRRQVDDLTIAAWHAVPEIAAADYDTARKVAIAHQTSPQASEYFQVRHLVAGLRLRQRSTPADVETDVRAAKARGIITADWDPRTPLTPEAAEQLAQARAHDRAEAERYAPVDERAIPWSVADAALAAASVEQPQHIQEQS